MRNSPTFDMPDPPAPEPERPKTACCETPSPEVTDDEQYLYCASCEAEYVPKAHLERARELYVELATKHERKAIAERGVEDRLVPGLVLDAALAAGRVFDAAIVEHAEKTFRVYGDPEGGTDDIPPDEPNPEL